MKLVFNREIIGAAINKNLEDHKIWDEQFKLMTHHWKSGKRASFNFIKSKIRWEYNSSIKWDIRCFFVPIIHNGEPLLLFSLFDPPFFKIDFKDKKQLEKESKDSFIKAISSLKFKRGKMYDSTDKVVGKYTFDEETVEGKEVIETFKRKFEIKDTDLKTVYTLPFIDQNMVLSPHVDGVEVILHDEKYIQIQKEVFNQYSEIRIIHSNTTPYAYCFFVFENEKKDKVHTFYCPESVIEFNRKRAERFRNRVIWREVNLQIVKEAKVTSKDYWRKRIEHSKIKVKYRGPNYDGPN